MQHDSEICTVKAPSQCRYCNRTVNCTSAILIEQPIAGKNSNNSSRIRKRTKSIIDLPSHHVKSGIDPKAELTIP